MKVTHRIAALVLAGAVIGLPMVSQGQIAISVTVAPPVLPVYDQPECPGDGFIWTPGYWAWDGTVADYYWVPGTWVEAPQVGYLWTPGYWGFAGGAYLWHVGYWGPHIGFYGGVNYGFGYFGSGYEGGYWTGGRFFYNTAINRVNVTVVHNTYVHNVTVLNNTRVAFNGGPGGTGARPSAGEQAAFRENHAPPTGAQLMHVSAARQDRSQFAGANHGQPLALATPRPVAAAGAFHGSNAVSGMRAGGMVNGGMKTVPTNNGTYMQRNAFAAPGGTQATPAPVRSMAAPAGGFLHAQPGGTTTVQPAMRSGYGAPSENHAPVPSRPVPVPQSQHAGPDAHGEEHHR